MLHLTPYRQRPGYCGPASLKMVLDYYGLKKTELELGKLARCNPNKGTSAEGILKAAKILGFQGFIKDNANLQSQNQQDRGE